MSVITWGEEYLRISHMIEDFCRMIKKDIVQNIKPKSGICTDLFGSIEDSLADIRKNVRENCLNTAAFEITDCLNTSLRFRLKCHLESAFGTDVPERSEKVQSSMVSDKFWFETIVEEVVSYRSKNFDCSISPQIIGDANRALAHYTMMVDISIELIQMG